MIKNKKLKRSTLMRYSKKQLVNGYMILQHNVEALNENFEIQYQNCMNIVDDMKLLNKTFNNKNKKSNK
jgi:hypothetical protein